MAEESKLIQLKVPVEVHQALKMTAAAEGTTMKAIVLDAILSALDQSEKEEGKTA